MARSLWLTRDADGKYRLWRKRPSHSEKGIWQGDCYSIIGRHCHWQAILKVLARGLRLRPSGIRQLEIRAVWGCEPEEVEEYCGPQSLDEGA